MTAPAPDKVMQYITGAWASSILGTAARHGIFTVLEDGPAGAPAVAGKAGLSVRGTQALLDGLTGLGLLNLAGGLYHNTPEASAFLVRGKPAYIGAMADVFLEDLSVWQKLPEAVKTGTPSAPQTNDVPDNPFWHALVPAIAPLSFPVAQMAAGRLGLATAGPVSWLDIGGGSGVWSAAWLGANALAAGYQLDWPNVNAIAREFVGRFGVGDRFTTIDGDFHTTELAAAAYDYAIYSHIAHQETPEDNVAVFRKVRAALKPGGTFLVNDFVLDDDRTGNPFAMMFACQMLLVTRGGSTYRQTDYRAWLTDAGFSSVEIVPTGTPATVVFAK